MMDKLVPQTQISGFQNISNLESLYSRYGAGIYTFCLHLLTNPRAAEKTTVNAFVQLHKEMAGQPDDSVALLRLREIAINESLMLLNRRDRRIFRL